MCNICVTSEIKRRREVISLDILNPVNNLLDSYTLNVVQAIQRNVSHFGDRNQNQM